MRHTRWLLSFSVAAAWGAQFSGFVRDGDTGHPLAGAIVTLGDQAVSTSVEGAFQVSGDAATLGVRANGYKRESIGLARGTSERPAPLNIVLHRFTPKALYLTVYGVGSAELRGSALHLMETTELNALVVDLKGDAGMIPYPAKVPLAYSSGARKLTNIADLREFAAGIHARGIYLIGRIVVFKDEPLASARRDLAVKTANGSVYRDREGQAWTDPFKQDVRDYVLALAEEAAQAGIDEIQFDYVRFPDAKGLKFSEESTEQSRERAISALFEQARRRLARYNVFLAGDVFGYTCWNANDTGIGQQMERLRPELDYICPMLYPSSFQFGIPGVRNPVSQPFDIVYRSLEKARERTRLPPSHFRPWLQAFKDYAFDRRAFGAAGIQDQIRAAEVFGSDGWMLWNAQNRYSPAGLRPKR